MKNKELESKINALEKQLQELKEQIKHQFSEDEKIILRNLDKKWKWIARDKNTHLWLFTNRPHKNDNLYCWSGTVEYCSFEMFSRLFQSIQWEDDKPIEIAKVIGK